MVTNCVPLQRPMFNSSQSLRQVDKVKHCEREFVIVDAKTTCVDIRVTCAVMSSACNYTGYISLSTSLFPLLFFQHTHDRKPQESRRYYRKSSQFRKHIQYIKSPTAAN